MLQVRDIMTTDLLALSPRTTVREALEALGSRHVSGAPVVTGGKLVGVVTGTDLMTFAGTEAEAPSNRESAEEWGVWAESTLEEEVEREEEPASAYFADLWDDDGSDVAERIAVTEGLSRNALDKYDVSHVMTRAPLVTVDPHMEVEAAADLMTKKQIHRVLVTDGDSLLGIVSASDVARAVADGKLTRRP